MPTTPTGKPRTEIGRSLFIERELGEQADPCESMLIYASTVAAIEAEARQQERERLLALGTWRAEDLGWCNKDDGCRVKADGAWLVLADMFPEDIQSPEELAAERRFADESIKP